MHRQAKLSKHSPKTCQGEVRETCHPVVLLQRRYSNRYLQIKIAHVNVTTCWAAFHVTIFKRASKKVPVLFSDTHFW